jgi:hypothetical protein
VVRKLLRTDRISGPNTQTGFGDLDGGEGRRCINSFSFGNPVQNITNRRLGIETFDLSVPTALSYTEDQRWNFVSDTSTGPTDMGTYDRFVREVDFTDKGSGAISMPLLDECEHIYRIGFGGELICAALSGSWSGPTGEVSANASLTMTIEP